MSSDEPVKVGTIGWIDLTVGDAPRIRDFYSAVTGWWTSHVEMGDYEDFCMIPPGTSDAVAGICHARGDNADLPAQWLIYITVEDAEKSAAMCVDLGGQVISGPRAMGESKFCVIRDPAGAVCALYQP